MPDKRVVIIGGGPTGLGAAYRLFELGYGDFHLYEAGAHLGGLASSFTDETGFTWDIGGHVMFSHYEYYDRLFSKLIGDDFQLNMRESWVRIFDRWVPYPFQNNIRYLPKEAAFDCMAGLIAAQTTAKPSESRNFDEFISAVFGEGIARHFMRPYNFKVWAHPPSMMNKEWIGERVAVIDISRALRNVMLEEDDFGWGPNNLFKYPLHGGTGEFYRRFGPHLDGHYTLNARVESIDQQRRTIAFTDGSRTGYDVLISTVPLDILCANIITKPDEDIARAASQLRHSGGYMVGLGLKQPCPSTKSWMYFPEDNCPFYRATYLSNYSKFMTPDNTTHYSLLCETSYSEFKPVDGASIVEDTIDGLENSGLLEPGDRKDIVSTWVFEAPYSYPTPSIERDRILQTVIPRLEAEGIYSRGRFGMWKYEVANTDHSLMQGVELIDRLLLGLPETTIGIHYETSPDGRKAARHSRSGQAGSGDPAKAASEHQARSVDRERRHPEPILKNGARPR